MDDDDTLLLKTYAIALLLVLKETLLLSTPFIKNLFANLIPIRIVYVSVMIIRIFNIPYASGITNFLCETLNHWPTVEHKWSRTSFDFRIEISIRVRRLSQKYANTAFGMTSLRYFLL